MEHHRTSTHQYVDAERYMFIDPHTGENERRFHGFRAIGTYEEAMEIIERDGMLAREILVNVDCIAPFRLPKEETRHVEELK